MKQGFSLLLAPCLTRGAYYLLKIFIYLAVSNILCTFARYKIIR